MRPSLRQLEYLVAVAETCHFGKAARACHVTQPGLSTQIKELERTLGVQLFERDHKHVRPTAAALAVIERARSILTTTDDLVDAARATREPLVGRLTLGVIPTVAPYLLPKVLPEVRKAWPELQILLREEETLRCLAELRDGRLDAAILALPTRESDLCEDRILDEAFLCAMPKGHRLAQSKVIVESDLDGEDILLLEDGHCLREQALAVCRRAGAREHADFRATSLTTLVQMVANGVGITLLPAMAADPRVAPLPEIVLRPFKGSRAGRTIGLCWRKATARARDFSLLLRTLRAHGG